MGQRLGRRFRRPMARHLHHIEVLLSDEVALHPQSKLVATGGGEDQRGNINAEIGNLQAIPDHNVRERCAAHQLFVVEVRQVDVEMIGALGVREAKIQPHLLMLERKGDGLEMGENADQAFLFRQTVFNNLVTDQESLDARFRDICHESYSIDIVVNHKMVPASAHTLGTAAPMSGAPTERETPCFKMHSLFTAKGG